MSWIVEAPNNNPSVFVLISATVFQIDGVARGDGWFARGVAGATGFADCADLRVVPTLTRHALRNGSLLPATSAQSSPGAVCISVPPASAGSYRPVLRLSLRAGLRLIVRASRRMSPGPRAQGAQGWSVRSRVASRVYRSTRSQVWCVSPWCDARSFDADRSTAKIESGGDLPGAELRSCFAFGPGVTDDSMTCSYWREYLMPWNPHA
jgi:hypothetical protein